MKQPHRVQRQETEMNRLTKTGMMLGVFGTLALSSTVAAQAADPAYAYTGDPAYQYGYSYSPGYQSYAYAPRYRTRHHYRGYGYDASTQSAPRHYDPGEGYNSNTVAPWQDWKYQGRDY
jgi:hypothetical protein